MCIVCRNHVPKKDLLRIVKTRDGLVALDKGGKSDGRGAYICSKDCLERAKKHRLLNRAFKCEIKSEVYESLTELL